MDEYKDWYESTILDTKTIQVEGENILSVHVAYRRYIENGDKHDPITNKRYKGWGPTFDIWLDAVDIQI